MGGGAFSGKDPTKVDRSGAYMARYIAKNLVAAGLCSRCQVTLAYAIGKAEPVMVEVDTFGTGAICADDCLSDAVRLVFGLTPSEIIAQLDLLTPRYTQTAAYGHFGKPELPWERTDQAQDPPGNGNLTQRKEHSHARSEQRADRRRQADDCHRVFAPVSPPMNWSEAAAVVSSS